VEPIETSRDYCYPGYLLHGDCNSVIPIPHEITTAPQARETPSSPGHPQQTDDEKNWQGQESLMSLNN